MTTTPRYDRPRAGAPRGDARLIDTLVDLLSDLHAFVTRAAAIAPGRLGRNEARPMLTHLLATAPTEEIVRAFGEIANDDDLVVLARTAAHRPELAKIVLDGLDESDSPRAAILAQRVRRTADRAAD